MTENYSQQPPIAQPNNPQPATTKEKNVLGIIALVVSIVGFIFACIPGALIIGWILLPIAFILSIVSLFLKGKGKGLGVAGLIISVVGGVVGFIVFFAVLATSFEEAFSGEEITATTAESGITEEANQDDQKGTRANPYPVGTTLAGEDWEVTINDVNLDATSEIVEENLFNDEPEPGFTYINVNVTITYIGDDENGEMNMTTIAYVTADGNTINSYDNMVVPPEPLDTMSTLYPGASTSGNIAFAVPEDTADQGTLAINVDLFDDKVFVAVK